MVCFHNRFLISLRPDVQVSEPIEKLIQSTLESKAPNLFKKILEIIDIMQQPAQPPPLPPNCPPNNEQYKPPPPEPPLLSDINNRVQTHEEITRPSTLEMPLDLLQFSTFSNPVNVRKGIKTKTKSEKHVKTNKQQQQHESNEIKVSNEKEKAADTPNTQHNTVTDTTVNKSTGTDTSKSTENNHEDKSVSSDKVIDDTLQVDTISEEESNEGGESDEGEGRGDPIMSSSTEDSPPPPKAAPTNVRRSARLASIEEDKKSPVDTNTKEKPSTNSTTTTREKPGLTSIDTTTKDRPGITSMDTNSTTTTRQRPSIPSIDTDSTTTKERPSVDIERVSFSSDKVMEINQDAIMFDEVKPKSRLVSRTRKRPTVISSSDSDSDNNQESQEVIKDEGRKRKQCSTRIRRLTRSSISSPVRTVEDDSSPEQTQVEKRSRKRKKL